MSLRHLIYVSRPLGYDPQQLSDILTVARARNAAADVTGMLISRWDLFAQFLEGPQQAVEEIFGRIRRDQRHVQVTPLRMEPAGARLFEGWRMRDDAVPSWLWSRADVMAGKHLTVSADDALGIFSRIAAELPAT